MMTNNYHLISLLLASSVAILAALALNFIIVPYLKIKSKAAKNTTTYFFPVLGFLHKRPQDFQASKDELATSKRFSAEFPGKKALITNLGSNVLVILRDPQYAKEFYQNQQLYKKSHLTDIPKTLLGTGLVFAEGDLWKHHRKIISTHFNYDFLKENLCAVQRTAQEFLEKIPPGEYSDYPAIGKVQAITGEVVGRLFFGEHLSQYSFEGKPLTLALADIARELSPISRRPLTIMFGAKVLNWPLFPKYTRLLSRVKKFRQQCYSIIQEHKKTYTSDPQNYLLKSLLASQELEDPEQRYSDNDIINEFVTFFFAGMDTTAHLIGMALYNIAKHPEYQVRLREERKMAYEKKGKMDMDAISQMSLLHFVLKETLRLYPPVEQLPFREAKATHRLVDINIKQGELVTNQFIPSLYNEGTFKDPYIFNPDRWTSLEGKLDPYSFTPFSAGSRNCIGQHLALMEAKVIVSEMLERYEVSLADGFDLRLMIRVMYGPDDDVRLRLRKIDSSSC